MQVAVDALELHLGQLRRDGLRDAHGHVAVARPEVLGHEVALLDVAQRLVDVVLDAQRGAMRRRARGAHGVQAAQRAADVAAVLGVQLVERAATDARERGVVDPLDLVQRGALAEVHRGDGGHLGLGEVGEELVLVQDGLARPAAGAVELHDQAALVLQLHLVHAVLEGAQRQAAAGRAQAAHLDGVEHALGREGEERVGFGHDSSSVS